MSNLLYTTDIGSLGVRAVLPGRRSSEAATSDYRERGPVDPWSSPYEVGLP